MRIRKAFLSCAVVATAGLLAAGAVTAEEVQSSCTTAGNVWTVTLTSGPSVVSCGLDSSKSCVRVTYQVQGIRPDHVAGLMPLGLSRVTGGGDDPSSGSQYEYDPGEGDPVFGLGLGDVSRRAFKVNPSADVVNYAVEVEGASTQLGLVPVRIKKGSRGSAIEGACALAGPAVIGTNPLQTVALITTEKWGNCTIEAATNPSTGVTNVRLVDSPHCQLDKIPAGEVDVVINGHGGPVKFSEAVSFVVEGSCTRWKQYWPSSGSWVKVTCTAGSPGCVCS